MIGRRGRGLAGAFMLLLGVVLGGAAGALLWLRPIAGAGNASDEGTPTAIITPAPAAVVSAAAPDFALTSLAGTRVSLGELRGSPVVLDFWATWCTPCQAEMTLLETRYRRLQGGGLRVLAINFDEPEAVVRPYVTALGLTFEVLLDPGASVQDLYRIRGYPSTFFLDSRGVVVAHKVGTMDEVELDELLRQIGAGGG